MPANSTHHKCGICTIINLEITEIQLKDETR